MKRIETLVDDIYSTVDTGVEIAPEVIKEFSEEFATVISSRLTPQERAPYLRLSNLGSKCDRKLWYSINRPELGEKLAPATKLKFLIGDVWEAVLLFLAKVSGHSVEGQQTKLDLHGVLGSRDAVIDGTLVDVKSASSRSFVKFEEGLNEDTDSFGYLTQLNAYLEASQNDDIVTDKSRAAFLAGDKTLGKLTLDMHRKSNVNYEKVVADKKEMLAATNPPSRAFSDEPEGKSGNRKLGVACSYCEFKKTCWPEIKTYAYASGPKFLTKVVKEPRVDSVRDHPF